MHFYEPVYQGYKLKASLEQHSKHTHLYFNQGEMPTTDLMRSNKILPKAYTLFPDTSNKRILPTFDRDYLAHESHWVEDNMRCRTLAPHADRCPDPVRKLFEHYSAYGHIRQRDHNKQLGKVLRDVARNGLVYHPPISHIPKYPITTHQCCEDKRTFPPTDFRRVLSQSTGQCRVTCRPRPVIDLPRPHEYTGRISY